MNNGWFHSSDLAVHEMDISSSKDRSKDIIILGENISSEVENTIKHPLFL